MSPKSRQLVSQRGSVSLEFTLIYGLLLGLILTVIHFGLLYHANLSAADAADVALEALQAEGSLSNLSSQELQDFAHLAVLSVAGEDPLVRDLQTSVQISGNLATVNVSASSPGLVAGLKNRTNRTASGLLEVFLSKAER